MKEKLPQSRFIKVLYLLPLLLLLPALLYNIGLKAFIGDEGIRALVAVEMLESGNFVTPTLHGHYYYNKPPLFNWIVALFYTITGQINEFTLRLVTVVMVLFYGATIWHFYRKHFDKHLSFLIAFSVITCGRILFYDSFLGLIDICFSWVMFTLMMVVYHRYQEGKLTRLFVEAYVLAAIGFMLKGLPAIVFVGITLLTLFIYKKAFRKLFAPAHFLGGFVFLLIVGSYYAVYHQYNSLDNVFTTLFTESSKRTVVNYGWWQTVVHFFYFPFESVYHFLPWSALFFFALVPKYFKQLRQHDFLFYNLLVFLSNIFIYWTSPEVYARYLLMFPPLFFAPMLYLYFQHKKDNTFIFKAFEIYVGLLIIVVTVASFIPHFLERIQDVPFVHLKAIILSALLIPLVFLFFKMKDHRLLVFVSAILTLRLALGFFAFPDRVKGDPDGVSKRDALYVAEKYYSPGFYVYKATNMEANYSYYLTKVAEEIIPRKFENFSAADTCIIDIDEYPDVEVTLLDNLKFRQMGRAVWVVRLEGTMSNEQ